MELSLEQVIHWIESLNSVSIYLIFGLIAYLENIVPPVPGDVMVAFGGYLVASGVIHFVPVLAITTIASVFGFMSMYAFGTYFGDRIEKYRDKFWLTRFIDVKYYDRGKTWMERWGQKVILANRFLAGTRSMIAIIAGVAKTSLYPTMISSAISSILWNSILIMFGWIVHDNWSIIGHYLNVYGWFILCLLVALFVARWLYKKKKKNNSPNTVD